LLRENTGVGGRDSYVSIIKEVYNVTIISKSNFMMAENSFEGIKEIFINDHAMWVFPESVINEDDDYRSAPISVDLSTLLSETDLPA